MTPVQASVELRKLSPLSRHKVVTPGEWAARMALISVVEQARQDQAYIARRNALIPKAEHFADATTTLTNDDPNYAYAWSRNFHTHMTELSKQIIG